MKKIYFICILISIVTVLSYWPKQRGQVVLLNLPSKQVFLESKGIEELYQVPHFRPFTVANLLSSNESYHFFDGWDYAGQQDNFDYNLTLIRSIDGKLASFNVMTDRPTEAYSWIHWRIDRSLRRELNFGGNSATVYWADVVNTRYIAFMTSEPGYIFFDRKLGKFLPDVFLSANCDNSRFLVSKTGRVYLHITYNEMCGDEKSRSYDRWYDVSEKLMAPISISEYEKVKSINREDMYFDENNE